MSNLPFPAAVRDPSLDLLARAALAPRDQAVTAWRAWRGAYDIETTPWPDVRMLGAVAARIEMLEPDASIRPRILGIRKFLWVQSQICLRQAEGGLAALRAADVPVLLMKGAARIASDPASAQERLIRDVDVLVPLRERQRAFDVLCRDGWSLVPEAWQMDWHRLDPVAAHHAWSLSKEKAEIDLHHFSNHLNRLRGDDDGLWRRSRALTWRGIPVRVPSPADALLLALTHGIRWSHDASADWAVDASALLDAGNVEWDVFMAEASARRLEAVLVPGLLYLRDVLRKPVPEEVPARLQASVTANQRAELEQYVQSAFPDSESQRALALMVATQRMKARVPDLAIGTVGRPRLLADRSIRLAGGHRRCVVPLPPLGGRGRIQVRVKVAGIDGSGKDPAFCAIHAPGLTLGIKVCRRTAVTEPDFTQVTVPEPLLDLREIRNLRLFFRTKNYRGGLSVEVSIWRL